MAGSDLDDDLWSACQYSLVKFSDLELRLHRTNTVKKPMSAEQKRHREPRMGGRQLSFEAAQLSHRCTVMAVLKQAVAQKFKRHSGKV